MTLNDTTHAVLNAVTIVQLCDTAGGQSAALSWLLGGSSKGLGLNTHLRTPKVHAGLAPSEHSVPSVDLN